MKLKKILDGKRGFTLIELMLVVSIIAVVASIMMPRFDLVMQKAFQAAARNNLGSIRSAVHLYYTDQEGVYPLQGYSDGYLDVNYGISLSSVLCPRYISKILVSPLRDRVPYQSISGMEYDKMTTECMGSNPIKDVVLMANNHEMQVGYFRPYGYDQGKGQVFIWNDNYDSSGNSQFDSW